jgi:hypothetical protein
MGESGSTIRFKVPGDVQPIRMHPKSVNTYGEPEKRSRVSLRNRLFAKVRNGSTELNGRASVSHSAFGTTLLDGSESSPVPEELLADTVKV